MMVVWEQEVMKLEDLSKTITTRSYASPKKYKEAWYCNPHSTTFRCWAHLPIIFTFCITHILDAKN